MLKGITYPVIGDVASPMEEIILRETERILVNFCIGAGIVLVAVLIVVFIIINKKRKKKQGKQEKRDE